MISNGQETNRRTLTFPAIKPCACISRATLITSLLSLTTQIYNYKTTLVHSPNKQTAKKVINLVEIMQVIFQELNDKTKSKLPRSITLSLINIHVVLQKLQCLFHDLTRPDARAWMLVNHAVVVKEFEALVVSLVSGVRSLSWEILGLDCNDEVMSYVGLVIRQGSRSELFKVESQDVLSLNVVHSIFSKFEKRVIPDIKEVKRVIDYLGVKSWGECNSMVKFLEEEVGWDHDEGSKLLGFLVYARCVLFDAIEENELAVEVVENERKKGLVSCLNVEDLKCPISLEVMVDPVTIESGHTYDRASILQWFKAGNPVCPKTGQMLESLDLVPNLVLKGVIKKYCEENGVALVCPKVDGKEKGVGKSGECNVGSLVAEGAIRMVADFLSIKLMMGSGKEKCKAAYEIRLLTKRSGFNRGCFVESRAICYLLSLLLSKDSTAQEHSSAALLYLSKHPQSKAAIVDNGGIGLIVGVLKNGLKIEARQHAAATLFYLSSVEEYRRLIGNNSDAITSLVELIRNGGDRGRKNALVAIYALLMLQSNYYWVLRARLVPLLVSLIGTFEREDLVVDSLAVLAALAERPDGARAILRAKALDMLVGLMCSSLYDDSSKFGREHCVSLLLALSIHCGREVVEFLVKNTSLMGALYAVLAEGTSRASKKASSLIGILQEHSERNSSRLSMAHGLAHENFIHVW